MARPKEFDRSQVLEAAARAFADRGFEGTHASYLVTCLGIGRQSIYDSFGDKWGLYLAAVGHYLDTETRAHLDALRSEPRALDGIHAMFDRIIDTAALPCLGLGSTCEFGATKDELSDLHQKARQVLHAGLTTRIAEAQKEGDIDADLDPDNVARFLIGGIANLRLSGRSGADHKTLEALKELFLRAMA